MQIRHREWLTCLWQVKDGMNGAKRFTVFSSRRQLSGISLVFREMRDTTGLSVKPSLAVIKLEGRRGGIPHLAKNERDMGYPAIVVGTEKRGLGGPFKPVFGLSGQGTKAPIPD